MWINRIADSYSLAGRQIKCYFMMVTSDSATVLRQYRWYQRLMVKQTRSTRQFVETDWTNQLMKLSQLSSAEQ